MRKIFTCMSSLFTKGSDVLYPLKRERTIDDVNNEYSPPKMYVPSKSIEDTEPEKIDGVTTVDSIGTISSIGITLDSPTGYTINTTQGQPILSDILSFHLKLDRERTQKDAEIYFLRKRQSQTEEALKIAHDEIRTLSKQLYELKIKEEW